MNNDLEIARKVQMKPISEIAAKLGIDKDVLEPYGHYKAKLPLNLIDENKVQDCNMILVSAISPTPAGEGKSTTSIGLTEGLNKIGKKATVVLREPSLGPVFGIKGGATGGGHSQVVPMEDINLHFTGDFSAIEKAHNLLSALIDNNIQSKTKSIGIDARTVLWKRVMDMNDRALRNIIVGLGGTGSGIPRETGFDITAASEVMAILCLSKNLADLKERLGNIFVGFKMDRTPVYARDLVSDYVVTEAGFGADLGAEKFLDIKCQSAGIAPKAVVIVATVRALKYHGGVGLDDLKTENVTALKNGLENMDKHIENIQQFGITPVVAINKFVSDTNAEHDVIKARCAELNVKCVISDVWGSGGEGAIELANEVVDAVENGNSNFEPMYDWASPVKDKIEAIAKKVYGASSVECKRNRDCRRCWISGAYYWCNYAYARLARCTFGQPY